MTEIETENAAADSPPRKSRQLLKRHFDLIEYVSKWATAILGILCAALNVNGYRLTSYCFGGTSVTLLTFCVYLYARHRFYKNKPIQPKIICAFLTVAICVFVAGLIFIFVAPPKAEERFQLTTSGYMLQLGERSDKQITEIFKANIIANKAIITRIPVFLYISLKNTQQRQSSITGIHAEGAMNQKGPWIPLCHVNLRTGNLYLAMSTESANQVNATNALDNILPDRNIGTGETINGWSAWSCNDFKQCSFPFAFIRMTFDEVDGISTQSTSLLNAQNNMTKKEWTLLPSMLNFKQYPIEFRNCDQ
jgi:hypothetical protein